MGKKTRKLKRHIRKLQSELMTLKGKTGAKPDPTISPLAPAGGFPVLPQVGGVAFAAGMAGVKYPGRKDVMAAFVQPGCSVAGVFTRSSTRSAAILDCESKLAKLAGKYCGDGVVIIANSGNANAFTGQDGKDGVEQIAACAARHFGVSESSIFTASTGVIGERLPHDRIEAVMASLSSSQDASQIKDAAEAIMTTDTFPKGASDQFAWDNSCVNVVGIAKGSGMIAPDMATMLAFIFTDANVEQKVLQQILTMTNRNTFNAISVDGDTSTSDLVLVVASGASCMPMIRECDSDDGRLLANSLKIVMTNLAQQIVRDGEGATKFITVNVEGACTREDAEKVAKSIANSPLVKTAMAGEDPNWGRIVMAVGKSGATANRDRLGIRFGGMQVAENGRVAENYNEEMAENYMKNDRLEINVDLGLGDQCARMWTCDLSDRYISINADYRS